MTDPNIDPLESFESVPSVSFDPSKGGVAEGDWVELVVTDYIKLVQAKDDNGKPAVYEDSGKPIMKFVLPVQLNGEDRALWGKFNNVENGLMRGLRDAQLSLRKETGDPAARVGPGTKLAIRWAWNTALPKKLGNHPKKYEVKATAGPAPAPKQDPLATEPTPRAAASDPWASSASSSEPPF